MAITNFPSGGKLDSEAGIPLYLQLAEIIAGQIRAKTLSPGSKLPPERDLASLFAVSRTTAINAYRHLEHQGLVVAHIGSGTYVASDTSSPTAQNPAMPWEQLFIPHLKTPMSSILRDLVSTPTDGDTISLAAGMPDPAFYPLAAFDELLTRHFKSMDPADLGHIPTEGFPLLRELIAERDNAKGIPAAAHNVLILAGSQQGVYLINRVFIEPGDYVIVEAPTYIGAIQAFQAAGARILTLPTSENFPLELLDDYLTRYRPKLFYTVSTFQNPSGRVISLADRQEILHLAARYRLIIIEDDPYGDLYYDAVPPPPLKALDEHGCVLYLGTFSKILFPGLRIGWLEGPPLVVNRLAQEKQYIDLHCNNLTQWILAHYLQENSLDHHISQVRIEYKRRRDAMASAIQRYAHDDLDFDLPGGGFYLWCRINRHLSSRTLMQEAARAGVTLVPGEAFYTNPGESNEIRLCFATHEESVLTEGIKRLAKILSRCPVGQPPGQASFDLGPPII